MKGEKTRRKTSPCQTDSPWKTVSKNTQSGGALALIGGRGVQVV